MLSELAFKMRNARPRRTQTYTEEKTAPLPGAGVSLLGGNEALADNGTSRRLAIGLLSC